MVNRRSNLLTRRFTYFGTWESIWVGDSLIYSDLVYQDFKIVSFLNGLFKKLSIPTGKFNLVRYFNSFMIIETDLYVIRPFWILYSHFDSNMESSFLYYFIRLFFNLPKLILYANMNKFIDVHFFSVNRIRNLFFLSKYRNKVKELQLFLDKKNFFYESFLFLLNKFIFSHKNGNIDDKFLRFGFFPSYDVYQQCIFFFLDYKKLSKIKNKNKIKIGRVSMVIYNYYRSMVEYKLHFVEWKNKRTIEFLRINFSRSLLLGRRDYLLNSSSELIRFVDVDFGYFKYKLFVVCFFDKVLSLIFFFFLQHINNYILFSIDNICRKFSLIELSFLCNFLNGFFLFFFYKMFLFSSKFSLLLRKNRLFRKLLKIGLVLHRFLFFIYSNIFCDLFKFSSVNLYDSFGFFVFKVRKALLLFSNRNFMFSKKFINKIFLFLCIFLRSMIFVYSKRNRFFFFNYLVNFFPFFVSFHAVRFCFENSGFLSSCFHYEGLFNFYFSFVDIYSFLVSNVFVKFINFFNNMNYFLRRNRFFYILRNILCLKCSYYYNYYYHIFCVFFFNYLFLTNLKLIGLFFDVSKINLEVNVVQMKRINYINYFQNDFLYKFSYLLILFSKFVNVFFVEIKNNLWNRRVFLYGYYKNFFVVESFNFLYWLVIQLRIRLSLWYSFFNRFKKLQFRYIKCFGRKFLFLYFNRIRTYFYNFVKRRIFTYLFFLNKRVISFISLKLFSISFDRLIHNLEFVFSEYLRSSVLFLPNLYFERFKRFFWTYRGFKKFKLLSLRSNFVIPFFCSINERKKSIKNKQIKRLRYFRSYWLFNYFLIFKLFFKYNKIELFKLFFRLLKDRKKKFVKSRIVLFFIRYVIFVYTFFFRRKFFVKKNNLRRLCLMLGKFNRLCNRRNALVETNNEGVLRDFLVDFNKFFIFRNLRKNKHLKRFLRGVIRFDLYSKKRRFFLRRSVYNNYKLDYSSNFSDFVRKHKGPRLTTSFPPIKDAKLLSDYIVYYLNLRIRLDRIFSNLRYWQNIEYRVINTLKHTRWVENELVYKKYPLCGIRILCSGSFKKGGRKRRNYYHLWIRNQRLTRKMPLQTIEMDIDYFSSSTNVVTGTVGVKVWLCFSTISYRYRIKDSDYYV